MAKKDILEIDGSRFEGGGQILRTASALSIVASKPIRVFKIRAKRPEPGLKAQHLYALDSLRELTHSRIEGLKLGSEEIRFFPEKKTFLKKPINVNIGTAGSIGLLLQPLLLAAAFRSEGVLLNVKGGTCGLGAIPVDYYPNVILPVLYRSGLRAKVDILRRGYYPKGGGEISAEISPMKYPKPIVLSEQGRIKRISGFSIASRELMRREVAQRQAMQAQEILSKDFSCPVSIRAEYAETYSLGSELNLYCYTDNGCILGSDARGEVRKTSEDVAIEACDKLKKEITSGSACDVHLADNLIPWLALLGGSVKTSEISEHSKTNMWVVERFFGKIFTVEGDIISVKNN